MRTIATTTGILSVGLIGLACSQGSSGSGGPEAQASGAPHAKAPSVSSATVASGAPTGSGTASAAPSGTVSALSAPGLDVSGLDPERALRLTTKDLVSLVEILNPKSLRKRWKNPQDLLDNTFGVGSVWYANQGNASISHPYGSRKACIDGLKGVVLQTAEQREICGADYMVPIYKDGNKESAKVCIDIFELPNRPCELPLVWISPSRANEICQIQGKRLCTQEEWVLSCRGNPDGADLQEYAYGDDLDLTACHTRGERSARCDPTSVKTTWATCATDTAPAGSFPRCRSRFGVFDLHGNVAEIMKRWDKDRDATVTQLKGSAFFYEPISMRPTDPPNKLKYPDHCAHNPRWHVEKLETAGHTMYHLGGRCCKDIKQ